MKRKVTSTIISLIFSVLCVILADNPLTNAAWHDLLLMTGGLFLGVVFMLYTAVLREIVKDEDKENENMQ